MLKKLTWLKYISGNLVDNKMENVLFISWWMFVIYIYISLWLLDQNIGAIIGKRYQNYIVKKNHKHTWHAK